MTVVFVALENTKIELLFPLGEKSPIAGFLAKNSNGGIHHVCIEVDDIQAAVKWVWFFLVTFQISIDFDYSKGHIFNKFRQTDYMQLKSYVFFSQLLYFIFDVS